MSKCLGCGITLQSVDAEKIGFIPEEKKETGICSRCFRLLHYNEFKNTTVLDNQTILDSVNKSKTFAFFLVDVLNINKETIKTYKKITIPKCLVISKCDYLSKSIKFNRIAEFLKNEYQINEEIIFLSAKYKRNIHLLIKIMAKENASSAYLLGYTNAGKSTLVNTLQENFKVTTSHYANTTVDFLKINLEDGKVLYDSPGFQYKEVLYPNDAKFYKKLNPKNNLKPITYLLKNKESILIENFFRMENQGEKCHCTFYLSSELLLEKVYEKNMVCCEEPSIEIKIEKGEELVIFGIGFVTFSNECTVKVHLKSAQCLEKRHSMFRGEEHE